MAVSESFNPGDIVFYIVFYKRSPGQYLQCKIAQIVGGENGDLHHAFGD